MRKMSQMIVSLVAACCVLLCLQGCSAVRHVPEGEYLLDKVNINVEGDKDVAPAQMWNYLRQTPNHKVLGFWKLQLGTYNLSGHDTTKWYNRWVRRMGQAPVLYDEDLTRASSRQLRLALVNRGYLEAQVDADTIHPSSGKRVNVIYNIVTGEPHLIRSIDYEIADPAIAEAIVNDRHALTVGSGEKFDRDVLDQERTRLVKRLRSLGYYAFNRDDITFIADTAEHSREVDLTMVVGAPKSAQPGVEGAGNDDYRTLYRFGTVTFVTNTDVPRADLDTVNYRDVTVLYGSDRYLNPGSLEEKNFMIPGRLYSPTAVDRTYESLTRLGILRTINIELRPAGYNEDGTRRLDAYVMLTRNKKQSITFDVEGTNSEGDLGFGIGATYQHRNLARGSQLLTARMRMNYESLSGSFDGLINDRYTEFAGEVGITFPRFEFPFAPQGMRQRFNVSSELAISGNYQERPEYSRIISGAAWRYKWNNRTSTRRHEFDLIDISYIYLPSRTNDFLNAIAPDNPLLRYSYEDHLITSMGYRYYHTNRRIPSIVGRTSGIQPRIYTIRASVETSGNLVYALCRAFDARKHDGAYEVFNTRFAQYVKGEVDYSSTYNFDHRHSLAWSVGAGIGVPYGNSKVLPFEKRFYAGGANGVRGWSVRTLGPGSFDSRNSVSYFINQCGDIRLDMSLEYRAKLFWVLEAGAFIDGGNIWTIHNYENQPGGMFHFDTFWKQIAASWGVGLRMDFNYFLLRLDLGVKAYNPASGQPHWSMAHFNWHRDTAIHFAVGYPF